MEFGSKQARPVADVEEKIIKYERFIDEKLRPDLEKVLRQRDANDQELG